MLILVASTRQALYLACLRVWGWPSGLDHIPLLTPTLLWKHLFPGQVASLTLVATACWFMWSIGGVLTFFYDLKTFLTLLAIAGNVLYQTQLTEASSSWSCLICCFCSSFIATYCVSTLTFHKDGAISQSADTADANADADKDEDVVLDSLVFHVLPPLLLNNANSIW